MKIKLMFKAFGAAVAALFAGLVAVFFRSRQKQAEEAKKAEEERQRQLAALEAAKKAEAEQVAKAEAEKAAAVQQAEEAAKEAKAAPPADFVNEFIITEMKK